MSGSDDHATSLRRPIDASTQTVICDASTQTVICDPAFNWSGLFDSVYEEILTRCLSDLCRVSSSPLTFSDDSTFLLWFSILQRRCDEGFAPRADIGFHNRGWHDFLVRRWPSVADRVPRTNFVEAKVRDDTEWELNECLVYFRVRFYGNCPAGVVHHPYAPIVQGRT